MKIARQLHSSATGRGVRRREFLQGAAALGAVATLGPVWLTGCSDDSSDSNLAVLHQEREQHTLHFDLSEFPPDGVYALRVIRSATPQVALQRHTAATRQGFAQQNALLVRLASKRLTHYCEVVDLPADAPQHLMLFELSPAGNTPPIPLRSHLHIPSRALRRHAEQLRASGETAAIHTRHSKMLHFGLGAEVTDDPDWMTELNNISTPLDATLMVVYHHPSILNLDEDPAATGTTRCSVCRAAPGGWDLSVALDYPPGATLHGVHFDSSRLAGAP